MSFQRHRTVPTVHEMANYLEIPPEEIIMAQEAVRSLRPSMKRFTKMTGIRLHFWTKLPIIEDKMV